MIPICCRNLSTSLVVMQVFVRGTLCMWCADGVGRSKQTGGKHPNAKTVHPCLYCMARQCDDDHGGDLGQPAFDIVAHRRTYGRTLAGFAELAALAGRPVEQAHRSMELGLNPNPDSTGLLLPLWGSMIGNPFLHAPMEILHVDALVRYTIAIGFPPPPNTSSAGLDTTSEFPPLPPLGQISC